MKKRLLRLPRFLIFLFLLSANTLLATVTVNSVSVTPDTTNYYGGYNILFTTAGNGLNELNTPDDHIIVVFDTTTVLPASISSDDIIVEWNGQSEPVNGAVVVSGQQISFPVPFEIPRHGQQIRVIISANAGIRNPAVSGNHQLQVATTKPPDNVLASSPNYMIYQSVSTVSPAGVMPNPSIAGESAAYTVGFDVGAGGFLPAADGTITIAFDTSLTVPNGALSGVTVNGTAATAIANNDTVVLTSPVEIDNSGSVSVYFAEGAGIKNPPDAGNYVLSVKTSSEPTYVESDLFGISPSGQLSISAITSKPDTVNQAGEFSFVVRTGATGALAANTDSFVVIFPQNTFIPATIATNHVTISSGGIGTDAYAVSVLKADPSDDDTVFVVTPINILGLSDITLTFTNSAGYTNPSISGNYSFKLASSAERVPVVSNPYAVYPTISRVDQALVIPTNNSANTPTDYTINFNLGRLGRLAAGTSTITITFPSVFALSESLLDYWASTITVAGGSPVSISSALQVNNANHTIEVAIPSGVQTANSNNIVLFLGGNTPITNPANGNYQLDVRTSVETSDVKSYSFGIGGQAIDITSVTLGDPTVNGISQYTMNITTHVGLSRTAGTGDYIRIVFPQGTTVPATIANTAIQINPPNNAQSVSINQSTRTVTAYVSQANLRAGPVIVVVTAAAGIINPSVPSSTYYKVTMSTSQEYQLRTSDAYTISGDATQVTNVTVSASPSVIDAANVPYTVNFTTSATGKIRGGAPAGSSTINVEFGDGTIVPTSISASNIEINSTPLTTASVVQSGQAGTVALTMPNGLTINNSTAATILFKSALGLTNGDTEGTYNLRVRTSSDTVYSDSTGASGDYTLALSQPLYVTSITPAPVTQNASASYSVMFTTGSAGALSAGNSIRIVFPQNTYLPPTLSASNVTVNGLNPSVNPTVQGDTLTIPAPATINGLTPVTVLINQIAGILNPTLAKGYTLKVITSAEAGPFTSPNYNITATTSTVSAATVTPVPYRPGLAAKYTIDFNVGTNGRLLPGTSTITVTFNSSTTVSTVPANYDSTYIVVDGVGTQITTIQIAGRAITMTVPSGVNIHNNDAASIILNRTGATKPITNPVSTGNYTLQVRTSVETSNITSNTYSITTANAVTGIRMVLADNIVNSESANTISFRVQNQITSPGGTVTITFPYNTFIPVTIAATRVSVAHNATNPTVFANASLVLTNPATRTVTVTVPATIPANDSVRVAIAATAGIQNPSIAGSNYNVQVKTTSQNINGTSAAYTLAPTSTTILNLGVVIDPITPSVNGEYTFTFQTGSRGRLVSGTSMIYLLLPDDATFTQGVPAVSKVTVNGAQADAVDLLPRTGTNPDTLIVTVPTSVTIGNMTNVTVLIDVTAGLRNASTTASRRYEAFTSVETGSVWLDASLPVELTHFACESRSGKVYLDWTTESEVENAYWMIQRKKLTDVEAAAWKAGILQNVDGESSFETIDHVDGKGSISIQTRYTFVDSIVEVGSVYAYRLADVSYNGTVTYHEAVYQEVKAPLEFKLYKNFPNPFNPSTTIRYSLPMDSRVELKVFNILGQVVTTLTDDMLAAGYHTIQWNGINRVGSQVASGTYFLYFSAKSVNSNQQFTKVMKILLLR